MIREIVSTVVPGRLPSIVELAARHRVRTSVVQSVIGKAASDGLVEVKRGLGIRRRDVGDVCLLPIIDLVVATGPSSGQEPSVLFGQHLFYELSKQVSRRSASMRLHTVSLEAAPDELEHLTGDPSCRAVLAYNVRSRVLADALSASHIVYFDLFPADLHPPDNSVQIDDAGVVELQVNHLIGRGHRRIGYLHLVERDRYHHSLHVRREQFFRMAASHGLLVHPDWVQFGGYQAADIRAAIEAIFRTPTHPTALILSDIHLVVAYDQLRRMGLRVPQDVSIIGMDDLALARSVCPQATTVAIDLAEAARTALGLLTEQYFRRAEPLERPMLVPMSVAPRASVAPPLEH